MKSHYKLSIIALLGAMVLFSCNTYENKRPVPDLRTMPKEAIQTMPDGTIFVIDTSRPKFKKVVEKAVKQPTTLPSKTK